MILSNAKEVLCPECGTDNNRDDLQCKECNHELILNEKYYLTKI